MALIDTGVVPVDGLRRAGKLYQGPDLSLESQDPDLTHLDTNGHGTHMAGIIAGRDDAATANLADPRHFVGLAPMPGWSASRSARPRARSMCPS